MTSLIRTFLHIENDRDLLQLHGLAGFDDFMSFSSGESVSRKRGRMTVRIEMDGRAFYLKRSRLHLTESLKTLSRFRLPSRNAVQEWKSIQAVRRAGIPTPDPLAFGERRILGIETASFIMTEELYEAKSLEEVFRNSFSGKLSREQRNEKCSLIRKTAEAARRLHAGGMNHQDFYLSHFYLGSDGTLYIIDLQRVCCRLKVPRRYVIKDLGQLNFSADDAGVFSRADKMRFFMDYLGVASLGVREKGLARKILAKTERIARHTVKLLARRRRRGEIP